MTHVAAAAVVGAGGGVDRRGSWSEARGGPPGTILCPRHCRQWLIGSLGPWPSFFESSKVVVLWLRWRVGGWRWRPAFWFLRSVLRRDFAICCLVKANKWHLILFAHGKWHIRIRPSSLTPSQPWRTSNQGGGYGRVHPPFVHPPYFWRRHCSNHHHHQYR